MTSTLVTGVNIVDLIKHFSSPLLSGFFSFWDILVIGQRYQGHLRYQVVACVKFVH